MQDYVRELVHLYKEHPALYALDHDPAGFQWINCIMPQESIISFIRNGKKKDETLLVVCNFTSAAHKDFSIGVPYKGKYKEIFNSDAVKFGGEGYVNARLKQARPKRCDGREYSMKITVPPLGISIFKCMPMEDNKIKKK